MTLPEKPAGLFPDIPTREEDIADAVNNILASYFKTAIPTLRDMVRRDEGKQKIAPVEGRPEDLQRGIDSQGEAILAGLIREKKLPSLIIGEHATFAPLGEEGGEPDVYFAVDPFDNTTQYTRGLFDTEFFSVVGAYDKNLDPIAGFVGNIKDRQAVVAVAGAIFISDLESEKPEERRVEKSKRRSIKEDGFTFASFTGDAEYDLSYSENFIDIIKNAAPGSFHDGGGGAYVYGMLAAGMLDAYIMINEPRGEIDPGLPLAQIAGCTILSVNPETGEFEDYKFDPKKHKENIPFLVAACTRELAEEIVKIYLETKKQKREEEETRKIYEKVASRHPDEIAALRTKPSQTLTN